MLIQPVLVAVKENGQCWEYKGTQDQLGVPYEYTAMRAKGGVPLQISVPVGFICDGASSPRFAWSLTGFLPRGIHDPAALVHDFLYTGKGKFRAQRYSRHDADFIFYRMLLLCGVKKWHCALAYFAVRAAGWYYWNKKAVS